mmetsp:Transcript_3508/g.8657  ORF Transcript_3508/g.8657 Transcript_3508/m.8657 type:complete len:297 (-) Transcript_3508:561-1451(-)
MHKMSELGRYLAAMRAEMPVSLSTSISLAFSSSAATTADTTNASQIGLFGVPRVSVRIVSVSPLWSTACSAVWQMRAMVRTVSSGYSPFAVSPESITASQPSSTAFAVSAHSARVGRGDRVIESSICVAQITGLPRRLALATIHFCARNTFSCGISIPRSPRATITPSASSMISSMLRKPSAFSILATMPMSGPRISRISRTCSARRTNEANTKSTACARANSRSARSFFDTAGRSSTAPGRLTPFREPTCAEFSAMHCTTSNPLSSCWTSSTTSDSRPSSTYTLEPFERLLPRLP